MYILRKRGNIYILLIFQIGTEKSKNIFHFAFSSSKRVSKVRTLHAAIDYILQLQRLCNEEQGASMHH